MIRRTTFVKTNASIPLYGSFASLPRITPPTVSTGGDDAGRHLVNPVVRDVTRNMNHAPGDNGSAWTKIEDEHLPLAKQVPTSESGVDRRGQ